MPFDSSVARRIGAASNPRTPLSALEKLALDEISDVRLCVASNPNIPVSVLEKLAFDENCQVRGNVAKHPNTPTSVLEKLAYDKNSPVRNEVASNPHTPTSTLDKLAVDTITIPYRVVTNRNISAKTLVKLAVDEYDEHVDIREIIVERIAQLPDEILQTISIVPILEHLCQSPQPTFYRLLALLHPETPPTALMQHVRSTAWIERSAIVQNPNTPDNILEQLTKDANVVVRAAAKAQVQQRATESPPQE